MQFVPQSTLYEMQLIQQKGKLHHNGRVMIRMFIGSGQGPFVTLEQNGLWQSL